MIRRPPTPYSALSQPQQVQQVTDGKQKLSTIEKILLTSVIFSGINLAIHIWEIRNANYVPRRSF